MSCKPYLNQVYKEIKEECLRTGKLFKDDKFPPCDKSINYKKSSSSTKTKWIRAKNLVKNPQFVIDGISRDDLDQGSLGDCWFISAIAAIVEISEYRQKVIPDDQGFDKDYCGIFHFRFWQKGVWVDVVVDDYLPVDENNELLYLNNSKRKNEFWCQLLEKAYAKLYYCYELLDGGMEEDSLTDMTGGVAERFDLNRIVKMKKSKNISNHNINVLWKLINQAFKMGSVSNASIWSKEAGTREVIQDDGLVDGHAYTVTGMDEKLKIIRIRNPHGAEGSEWNGAWSDRSNKWNSIDYETKKRLNFVKKNDGEFWMSFDDFINKFDRLTLVHINLNAFTEQLGESNETHSHWDFKQIFGKWKAKTTEIQDYQKHFWSNPQHVINLSDGNARQMIIALMSTDYNERRKQYEEYASLTFHLFRVINKSKLKLKYNSNELERVGKSDKYDNEREVSKRFYVHRGIYVIIPSTADRSVETNYLLRVFSESVSGQEADDDDDQEFEDDEDEEEEEDDEEEDDDDDDEEGDEDEEDEEDEEGDEDEEDEDEEEVDRNPKSKSKRY